MAPASPHRERDIFAAALEYATTTERAAFLDGACGSDTGLRARVGDLLRAHDAAGGFLGGGVAGSGARPEPAGGEPVESVAPADPGLASARPDMEGPGTRIGRYTILERIGEGGFGVVYLAAQQEPVRRQVALKIIKLGMDTRAVVARFEAERQALAMMDHPHIAKVFDGGATESGRPYFVMELVRGVALTTFCDERRLTTRERIELFTQVCHAVQHAHQKGVIHRDLKPSNILVTLHDGRPVPKVIDFGIAKATEQPLTENSLLTRFHQFMGTPAYMSPEQVGSNHGDVDTRSDIYSLGVVLYELLAGCTPFDTAGLLAAGYAAIERTIREQDPPAPSQRLATLARDAQATTAERRRTDARRLEGHLRGDLDRIVMKCLHKDRTRRYETANGFAMDLSRYLRNEPVLARPDSPGYRFGRFVRRHRLPVAVGSGFLLVLVAGLIGTITQAHRARHHAARAETQRDFALRQLWRAEAINELNGFLLMDAALVDGTISVGELLARAEDVVDRQQADTEENRIGMLVTIGHYYLSLDLGARARAILEKAHARAAAAPELGLLPYASASLADALAADGEFERAEELFARALAELDTMPDSEVTRVNCLICGAGIARRRSDPAVGIARAEEAQRIVDRLPRASGFLKATVAHELAEAYRTGGRPREALAAFDRTWTQMVTLGREQTESAGTLLNNWGLTLYLLGRPAEAVPLYRRAVAISAGGGEEHVAPILRNNLARALHELGQVEEAVALVERGLEPARANGDEPAVNQILFSLVRLRAETGDFDGAATALAEVESRLRASRPAGHFSLAQIDHHQAQLALARGEFDAALAAANRAVEAREQLFPNREGLASMLVRRAEAHLGLGRFDAARVDAERALEIDSARLGGDDASCWLGHDWLALARALQGQGEREQARASFASALEHLRATIGDDHPATQKAMAGLAGP